MRAAINNLSFQYSFAHPGAAVDALERFAEICGELGKRYYHGVEKIQCDPIDRNFQLAPGRSLIQLLQSLKQDQISLLLTLFLNSPCAHEGEPFCVDGRCSYACAYAREGIIISLKSHALFSSHKVKGEIGSLQLELRNLSDETHIQRYAGDLDCRLYEPNPKHGPTPYRAGGRDVSPMPLSQREAQSLLDRAIEVDGHLLAKRAGTYFEFRRHRGIYFHGYQNDALPEQVRRRFDAQWSLL